MLNVIFDLDGTLANCDHRRHYVEGEHKSWDAFFDECDKDSVNAPVADVFRMYAMRQDVMLIILSGRMGKPETAIKTKQWLVDNDLTPDVFIMRKEGDYRHDVEVKKEMVDELGLTPENTMCVYDDRNSMVNAWRSVWGFYCLQVEEGNF